MTEERKLEMHMDGQWLDLTAFAKDVTIDHGAPGSETWGEKLAGLKDSSMKMAFDNSGSGFLVPESLFTNAPPKIRVTREIPDGRWQSFKWRLRSRFPRLLRRLKVRCRLYSFDAVLEPWQKGDEFGLSGTTTGPVSMGIEER